MIEPGCIYTFLSWAIPGQAPSATVS